MKRKNSTRVLRTDWEQLEGRMLLASGDYPGPGPAPGQAPGDLVTISTFRAQGAQVSWSPDGTRIAYAAVGADGYYHVHVANPDGSNDVDLSANNPALQHRQTGSPAWDPTGQYLVFVAEKSSHPGSMYDAIPGFGGYSDVWIMKADGSDVVQLTNVPNDSNSGTLIPRFSPDGTHLSWTQRVAAPNAYNANQALGYWELMTADITYGPGGDSLSNVQSFQPGGQGFYEGYGYSPDGSRILFSSDMGGRVWWDSQIFTMDASSGGGLTQLTNENDYNEHATYTPDGKSIIWMDGHGSSGGGTDWWIMDANGGEKRQLSFFNVPGNPEYMGQAVWAGLVSFNPTGTMFIGDVQTNLYTQQATIKRVTLQVPPVGSGTGLTGQYFSNQTLTGIPTLTRIDPTVNFDWQLAAPAPTMPNTNFSVLWTGKVQPRYTETYTFYTESDDGVRLWVNGQLLIDDWSSHNLKEDSGMIQLVAGQLYDIKMEYYQVYWVSVAKLLWSSPSQPKGVIPESQLYPQAPLTAAIPTAPMTAIHAMATTTFSPEATAPLLHVRMHARGRTRPAHVAGLIVPSFGGHVRRPRRMR